MTRHDAAVGGATERSRWTLVAVCATTFMLLVDITIVNVALPSVQRQLHASLTGLQWVVDAPSRSLSGPAPRCSSARDGRRHRSTHRLLVGHRLRQQRLCRTVDDALLAAGPNDEADGLF